MRSSNEAVQMLKPGQRLEILGYFVRQKLQGDKAVQGYIFSLVHHAHPAATQLVDDAVVRDGLADHGIGAMLGGVNRQVNEG